MYCDCIEIGDDFAGSNFEHKEYSRSKLSCGSRHYIKASFNDRMGIKYFDQSRYCFAISMLYFGDSLCAFEIWNKITSAQAATSFGFLHCKKHSICGFLRSQVSLVALSSTALSGSCLQVIASSHSPEASSKPRPFSKKTVLVPYSIMSGSYGS
ncbi:hypothetical protein Bca101_030635 [Brassica carinata]